MTPPLIGLTQLARMAFLGEPLPPVSEALLARLGANENDANALLDLSIVLHLSGQAQLAEAMQREALNTQRVFTLPNTLGLPETETLRVLAFMVPGDLTRNTAIEFLVEGTPTTVFLLYVEPGQPLPDVPDHDVAFMAISESAANEATLRHLAQLTANWPKPMINPPGIITDMSRDRMSEVLQGLPGVHFPLSIRINREELAQIPTAGPSELWPLIVRPLDSHKGQGLARLNSAAELGIYLQQQPETTFFIAPFVDYRSADGLYRKYRVVLIDGKPFICHQCLSTDWMQHYMRSGMTEDSPAGASKRAEEAACFAEFDHAAGFGGRHAQAFAAIQQQLGLPYIGLDCGELPSGELLIFEVDCGMTVHAMDDPRLHPYKPPQMQRVFAAFHQMLQHHAA